MNYKKIYQQLIDRAITRTLNGYKERHHIVPKCMGGNNSKLNLVDLTAREHFIAHKLLCKLYPTNKGIQLALWAMVVYKSKKNQRTYKISSREYQSIRETASSVMREIKTGGKTPHSEETKLKIKIALTGKKKTSDHTKKVWETRNRNGNNIPWNKGLTGVQIVTDATREKMRLAHLGKKYKTK
jgi:hypothetical protein